MPALGRLSQEDQEFEASLVHIVRACLKESCSFCGWSNNSSSICTALGQVGSTRLTGSGWTTPNSDLLSRLGCIVSVRLLLGLGARENINEPSEVGALRKGRVQRQGSHLYTQAPLLLGKNINEIWIRIRHQERTAAGRDKFNCTRSYTCYSESPCAIKKT